MKNKFVLIAFALIILLLGFFFFRPKPKGLVEIKLKDIPVQVTVAKSNQELQKGLGGVTQMAANQGMLFVFGRKSIQTFWMKDTLIPLDMIWITAPPAGETSGKIANITKNVPIAPPGTADSQLPLYSSQVPVDFVLEVNAGFSDTHQLQVGDIVDLSEIRQ